MGEWMVQVPVKLDPETVARLDLLRGSYPFKPGRSTVIRELVEEGLRLIAEGIMQFRATASNRVPSVQSIPGTPQVFSSGELGKKPLARRSMRENASRGRDITQLNRKDVASLASRITPFRRLQHIHFTPVNERVA